MQKLVAEDCQAAHGCNEVILYTSFEAILPVDLKDLLGACPILA
jgi:hypothetical protein